MQKSLKLSGNSFKANNVKIKACQEMKLKEIDFKK